MKTTNKSYKYKYNIDDIITIRDDLKLYAMYGGSMVSNFMICYLGRTAKVTERSNGLYRLDIDNGIEVWTEDMFADESVCKTIYLDNASTTFPKFFAKDYLVLGNPNSSHGLGIEANKALDEARERIKKSLGVKTGKVLFCRCATEAVEWLCRKIHHYSNWGDEIIFYSPYEHDSVVQASEVATDAKEKKINEQPQDVDDNLREGDIYLHQYVNQLTGTIHGIESIGKQVQSTGAFFGSDFTAAIGHVPISKNLDTFCDAMWFSGHKFHAEQGIGAIWLSDRLFEYLGGEKDSRNEYELLHGTSNVSGAIAMSYAMEYAVENFDDQYNHYLDLYYELIDKLAQAKIDYADVGNKDDKALQTVAIFSLTLPGINADALATFLSSKGIYIGVGHSACADNEDYRVLEAFGLSKQEAEQTVRISFCEDTTLEHIDAFVEGIKEFKRLFL